MSKFCIFCGKKPDYKTKEHIIPQWLIKMTDHEDRKTAFGVKDEKQIIFPWMQYTFPACNICNEKYSGLEGRVKDVIHRLLNTEKLTQNNLSDLLDWIDKVRIGIWLGQSLLKGEKLIPNFYISQRIGISDRMLIINRSIEKDKGIAFTGTESLAFKFSPSCFSLTINHLTFFSYSSALLLSENMGFPFPENIKLYSDGKMALESMNIGKLKLTRPLLNGQIIIPAIKIYQTILKSNEGNIVSLPFNEYFIKNAILCKEDTLISKFFIIDDFSDYFDFLGTTDKILFKILGGYPRDILMLNTALVVFSHQKMEIERAMKSFEHLPDEEKKEQIDFFKFVLNENQILIDKIEKELRPTIE